MASGGPLSESAARRQRRKRKRAEACTGHLCNGVPPGLGELPCPRWEWWGHQAEAIQSHVHWQSFAQDAMSLRNEFLEHVRQTFSEALSLIKAEFACKVGECQMETLALPDVDEGPFAGKEDSVGVAAVEGSVAVARAKGDPFTLAQIEHCDRLFTGDMVEVLGLQKARHLNGCRGCVVQILSDRFGVLLQGHAEPKAFKGLNLRKLPMITEDQKFVSIPRGAVQPCRTEAAVVAEVGRSGGEVQSDELFYWYVNDEKLQDGEKAVCPVLQQGGECACVRVLSPAVTGGKVSARVLSPAAAQEDWRVSFPGGARVLCPASEQGGVNDEKTSDGDKAVCPVFQQGGVCACARVLCPASEQSGVSDEKLQGGDKAVCPVLQQGGECACVRVVCPASEQSGVNDEKLQVGVKAVCPVFQQGGECACVRVLCPASEQGGDMAVRVLCPAVEQGGDKAVRVVCPAFQQGGESACVRVLCPASEQGGDKAVRVLSPAGAQAAEGRVSSPRGAVQPCRTAVLSDELLYVDDVKLQGGEKFCVVAIPSARGRYSIGSGKGTRGTECRQHPVRGPAKLFFAGNGGNCQSGGSGQDSNGTVVPAGMEAEDASMLVPGCSEGEVQETLLGTLLEIRSLAEGLQDLAGKARRKQRELLRGYLGRMRGLVTLSLEQVCESDVLRALLAEVDLLLD